MKRLLLIAMLPLAVSACLGGGTPVQVEYRPVPYPVPAPCPDEAVHTDLTAKRPVPLAAQPKPPTAVERAARIAAQLGLYEAPGGWADLVTAALNRCQEQPVDAPLDSG